MKNTFVSIILCFLSTFCFGQGTDENIVPGQYIIQLTGKVDARSFFSTQYDHVTMLQCLSKSMNIWLVQAVGYSLTDFTPGAVIKLAQYNHTNVKRRATLVPNDPYFSSQWNMMNPANNGADISATQAWGINHSAVTQTGDSIVIAVIDGGFDIYHQDLNFFVNRNEIPYNGIDDDGNGYIDDYHGWNVFMNDDSVYDITDMHSTHVSGIAAAIGNNSTGVAGVCWGAKILAINGASTQESDVIKAYDYVINMRRLYDQTSGAKGAFIVATNSSFGVDLGQPSSYPIWCALYDSMGSCGILSACATANNNYNVDVVGDMPTGCPSKWMIAVTNTDNTDQRNPSAAYGPVNVDLGAPGTAIESTYPSNTYGLLTGTSMATPHVAGAVAAMIANACPRLINDYLAYPDSIALILRDYIYGSVDPLPALDHITTTGGRLNLYHAYIAESAYDCNNCHYALALSQQNVTCHGDSNAAITAAVDTGSGGYHYLWSTGSTTAQAAGLRAGFYQLTVTDSAGCQRNATALITEPSAIQITNISIIPLTDSSAGNIIFTATAGNDTLYYAMDADSFQTSAIFILDSPGVHHFRIRNAAGCETDTTVALFYASIKDVSSSISYMHIAPNPTSGIAELMLKSNASYSANLMLTDIAGRQVYQQTLTVTNGIQRQSLDISALADGLYILTVVRDGQPVTSLKVSVIK